MYKVKQNRGFKKSLKKYIKSGKFNIDKLNRVVDILSSGKKLEEKYRDHQLKGKFKDFRECHIEPDLLLMYQIVNDELILILVDLGSHSELFE